MPSRSLLFAGLVPLLALLYAQFSGLAPLSFLHGPHAKDFSRSKTRIVMASTPAWSHIEKLTTIASGLISLGYPIHFVTGPDFQASVEALGATFVPIEGSEPGLLPPDKLAIFLSLQGKPEQEVFAIKTAFIEPIPAQHRTLQATFTALREEFGQDTRIVYVNDGTFAGLAPVLAGLKGVRPDAAISIGLAPYTGASNDSFPVNSRRHPDTSVSSSTIHFEAHARQNLAYPDREWNAHVQQKFADMGTTTPWPSLYDMWTSASDAHLQYGVPEFEYPRKDYRPRMKFLGAPASVGISERQLPVWWDEVLEAQRAGKHIVAVTSSSVVFDTQALIIPALEAFGNRDDVLVIATLVTSDVEGLDVKIPKNARVAKFIPLDLALPFVSVLVTNGGYGTVQQGLRFGVPMIVSGVGQDKPHTGSIINYIGNGIYHAVPQERPEMLIDAFEEILRNGTYRTISETIAKAYPKYDAVKIVDETIQQALKGDLAW